MPKQEWKKIGEIKANLPRTLFGNSKGTLGTDFGNGDKPHALYDGELSLKDALKRYAELICLQTKAGVRVKLNEEAMKLGFGRGFYLEYVRQHAQTLER